MKDLQRTVGDRVLGGGEGSGGGEGGGLEAAGAPVGEVVGVVVPGGAGGSHQLLVSIIV